MRPDIQKLRCAVAFVLWSGCAGEDPIREDAGLDAAELEDATAPEDSEPTTDATGAPEDSEPAMDAPLAVDAGPEPCDSPGAIETVDCGACGSVDRFCGLDGAWEYGACVEPPDAECTPGERGERACGDCGAQETRCDGTCRWVDFGACSGEGACAPGAAERTSSGCASGETRGRICSGACGWIETGSCVRMPVDDFDGDGSSYAIDCDDLDPTIRVGTVQPCGRFLCDIGPTETARPGTRSCIGPGWSACTRATDCAEPALCRSTLGGETRPCPTEGCDRGDEQFRSCRPGLPFLAWSTCAAAGPRSTSCAPVESVCGDCEEGLRYAICDASCTPFVTGCHGRGCTPDTRVRSTSSCVVGSFHDDACSAECAPMTPGACEPHPREVDVLLLLEGDSGWALRVRPRADELIDVLVAGLLADPDVRVGLARFTDYPEVSFPMSRAFRGEVVPTRDPAPLRTALAVEPNMGAGGALSLIEALHEVTGGTPHPTAEPFVCPAGLVAGGCWRPAAARVVVVLTRGLQHEIPHPETGIVAPYGASVTPRAPTWPGVRIAARADDLRVYSLTPNESAALPQLDAIARELDQDPERSVVRLRTTGTVADAAAELLRRMRQDLGLAP